MVIQTNTDGQSYRGKVNVAERGKKSVEEIQGVQEKLCSFTIRCNPSLAYIAVEIFKLITALRMYSHSYWLVIFCTTNSS